MASSSSRASYAGNLTQRAQQRITRERQKLEKDREELEGLGIHFHFGEELSKSWALIVGPEGTPYDSGFYFFTLQVPDDYPMAPPRVAFKTGDGRVRFNPNLYVEGKVCLSILGTWSGPSWTTTCTLRTVLVSIQSLMSDHPIRNEPGHESESGKNDELYSEIIRFENIAVAVVRMLKHTPPEFQAFRPQMRRVFLRQVDRYLQTLEAYRSREGKTVKSPIWSFPCKFRVTEVVKELKELQEELRAEAAAAGEEADGQPKVEAVTTAGSCPEVQEVEPEASEDAAATPPRKRLRNKGPAAVSV